MDIVQISEPRAFDQWREQWEQVFCTKRNSVFVSFSWVRYHLNQNTNGFIVILHNNGQLIAGLPLAFGRLSSKVIGLQTLEHLCKAHTDYHEFLIDSNASLHQVSDAAGRFLVSNFPNTILKIDFPPSESITEQFLLSLTLHYRAQKMSAHYIYRSYTTSPFAEKKAINDIIRRERRISETANIEFKFSDTLSEALLNDVLDMHRDFHGESTLNCIAKRADIIALLLDRSDQTICSTLRIDGDLAACAISFLQNEELQYFAPATSRSQRTNGVGMLLLYKMKMACTEMNISSLCFLRGEEAYKVKLSDFATAVLPFVGVPQKSHALKQKLVTFWAARRTSEISVKRAELNLSMQRKLKSSKAIVIANGLNGLGVVRGLAKANIEVFAISPSINDLSYMSRLPTESFIEPYGDDWHHRVLRRIENIASSSREPIPLFTCSDKAANFVEEHFQDFPENVKCLYPSGDLTRTLNDKQLELELMFKNDIPIPQSVWTINNDRPFDNLTLPIIIKPKDFNGYSELNAKNRIVENNEQLNRFYNEFSGRLQIFVAQELIPGPDENLWVCNATFDKESQLVSAFTFRRMGTSPSHFGVTSMALSEHNNEVKKIVEQFGKALGYVGPGMWEFKFCERTSQYLYIETNPRLGMCNWFDTQCNVSNVLINYQLCIGQKPNPLIYQQTTGIYFLNLLGDTIARLEDKESMISIIRRLYTVFPGPVVWASFVKQDMMPTFKSSSAKCMTLFKRAFKKIAER